MTTALIVLGTIQLVLLIVHVFVVVRLARAREGLDKMILHLVEESSTIYAQNRRLNQKTADNLQAAARQVKELNGVKRVIDLLKESSDSLKEIATALKSENQSVGRSLSRLSTSVTSIETAAKKTASLSEVSRKLSEIASVLNKKK